MRVSGGDQRLHRIRRAGVDVAGLHADQRGPVALLEHGRQRVRIHPPLRVRPHPLHPRLAQPEEAQRSQDGDVHLFADHHVDLRGPEQPPLRHVPAGAGQQRVTCGSEPGEVRHLAAGDEAHPRVQRQPEEPVQPPPRGVLQHRHRGRGDVQTGVLVPGGGEPVRRQRDRLAPADDESEESRTGGGQEPRLARARQEIQHGRRVLPLLGELSSERLGQRFQRRRGPHRARAERGEPGAGVQQGAIEQRREGVHGTGKRPSPGHLPTSTSGACRSRISA